MSDAQISISTLILSMYCTKGTYSNTVYSVCGMHVKAIKYSLCRGKVKVFVPLAEKDTYNGHDRAILITIGTGRRAGRRSFKSLSCPPSALLCPPTQNLGRGQDKVRY